MKTKQKGLRLSIVGAVVFLLSLPLLVVLPSVVGVVGLLAGGFMVWGGLLWTIFGYYSGPDASSG